MSDSQVPEPNNNKPIIPNKPSSDPPSKIKTPKANTNGGNGFAHYPNPPDSVNPDAATLREQWRFAIRQYSKWYSHAWGTAILAGLSFFALGWVIKGSNPLPSLGGGGGNKNNNSKEKDGDVDGRV